MIDLHIHSNASADGQHTPVEIARMAAGLGLKAIALTDHNSIRAVAEGLRAAEAAGLRSVSGVELNTDHNGLDLHLLVYGFDPSDPLAQRLVADVVAGMAAQADLRLQRFEQLGLKIDRGEVDSHSRGGIPTGSSFLLALADHPEYRSHDLVAPYLPGGARSDSPFLHFYHDVLRDGPASVPVQGPATKEAIRSAGGFGGVSVLAHPHKIAETMIEELAAAGLDGLEAVSSYHSPEDTQKHLACAKRLRLLVTAGSDFHGKLYKPNVDLGQADGASLEMYENLVDKIRR